MHAYNRLINLNQSSTLYILLSKALYAHSFYVLWRPFTKKKKPTKFGWIWDWYEKTYLIFVYYYWQVREVHLLRDLFFPLIGLGFGVQFKGLFVLLVSFLGPI
jgi:hypothetical protein